MKIDIPPGKYIVAVSGGVDSTVLLDLLHQRPELELVVAHFDHGIRSDSAKDAQFVAQAAKKYNLAFELGIGNLGPTASEEKARTARYDFLRAAKQKHQARAIVTAHHQDDLIETAFLNLLRGSGRRGLVALSNRDERARPLLPVSKADILKYAKDHKLKWREDPSNQNTDYLRNYLRHKILNKLSINERREVLKYIETIAKKSQKLDPLLDTLNTSLEKNGKIDRQLFSSLPASVGAELLTYLFAKQKVGEFDKKTIQRANTAIRTAKGGSKVNVVGPTFLMLDPDFAWLSTTD